jgi:dihydrofolate synthase/folylpolyglutamate synthase
VTYFEAVTAAAFLLFAEKRVSLGILEVGLGGRLDATNVAPASVSVVTSIGLDHTADLGETLGEIAREKGGIFRRGRPALGRAAAAVARVVLREAAERAGSIWHDAQEELSVEAEEASLEGERFALTTPERKIEVSTPLPGEHQAWNAALAVRAAELLPSGLLPLDPEAVARGIAAVRWPGRLERFEIGGRLVVLDGCHNPEGAEALARFLRGSGLAGRFHLLFGAMADKDVGAIARILFAGRPRPARVATRREPRLRGGPACFLPPAPRRGAAPGSVARWEISFERTGRPYNRRRSLPRRRGAGISPRRRSKGP